MTRLSRVRAMCVAVSALAIIGISPAIGDIYAYKDARGRMYFTDKPLSSPKLKLVWHRITTATPADISTPPHTLAGPGKNGRPKVARDLTKKRASTRNDAAKKQPASNRSVSISKALEWKCFEFEGDDKTRCLNGEDPTLTQRNPQSDFRGFCWGASFEDVKAQEKATLIGETDDLLLYSVQITGKYMKAVFEFENRRLGSGYYRNMETHTNRNDYIEDYSEIKTLLIKKYGKPTSEKIVWKNDLYRDKQQDWGFAVSLGHLKLGARWELKRTTISTSLVGDNFKIYHFVSFDDKASAKQRMKKQEQRSLEDL